MKKVYRLQKSQKFGSKVFNPSSIISQMKERGLYGNDPVGYVKVETDARFRNQISQLSPLKVKESNKKNQESLEFSKVDSRPKI